MATPQPPSPSGERPPTQTSAAPDDTAQLDRVPPQALGPGADDRPVPPGLDERTVKLPLSRAPRPPVRQRRVVQILSSLDRRALPPLGRALARVGSGALARRTIAAVGGITCVAIMVIAVYAATRPAGNAAVPAAAHVGVSPGDSIPDYLRRSDALLSTLAQAGPPGASADRYALVSFDRYVQPAQINPVLGSARVAEVFMRARAAGAGAEIVTVDVDSVPDDVVTGMHTEANAQESHATELGMVIDRVGNATPDAAATQMRLEQQRRLARAEVTAYRGLCACVFAAVVHAPLNTLGTLRHRAHVRVVDVVPLGAGVDRDVFMPPLPEQNGIAAPPPVVDAVPPVTVPGALGPTG